MIRLHALSVRHRGSPVLHDIDLRVAPGELVALVGPAGAGKTALLEVLLGRLRPESGEACVDQFDLRTQPAECRSCIAWVPATPEFDLDATGTEWLRRRCLQLGRTMPEPVRRQALVRGGIDPVWHETRIAGWPTRLRRRLALTAATLENAPALLLDAPDAGLDEGDLADLVLALRRIRKRGTAVLLATRDLEFARRLATKIVLLEHGAVVETIDPNLSRRAYQDESYLTALLG
jgi:ABC-2 type transport system ATP-binding protein